MNAVLAFLAGLLILDAVLDARRSHESTRRRRERERNRAEMLRTIDRTGGRRD
jgi:hypothetical protein